MVKGNKIKDPRFKKRSVEKKKNYMGLVKLLAVFLVTAATVFALYNAVNYLSGKSVENIYEKYTTYSENEEYSKALSVYREAYERATSPNIFNIHEERLAEIVDLIETDLNSRIKEPFRSLVEDDIPFMQRDIYMLESFEEVSLRVISQLVYEYLEKLIVGDYNSEQAVFMFQQLERLDIRLETTLNYKNEIDAIYGFSGTMSNIMELQRDKKYVIALETANEKTYEEGGFVLEYLNRFILKLKSDKYEYIKTDIYDMMTSHMYYSAKNALERVLVFYPDDEYFLNAYQICDENTAENLVEYFNPVPHISVRPLISDRNFVFDKDGYTRNAEELLITADEFAKVLEQLYINDYILINIESLLDNEGKRVYPLIPEGRKPVIFSVEGLNYYASRQRTGNSRMLGIEDENKVVSTYYDEEGKEVTDRNGEAVGILDKFVEENPDFSFDGAKGNISLTGFECIFGFVVSREQAINRNMAYEEHLSKSFTVSDDQIKENISKALEIANTLKRNGWTFSSSTYGNIPVGSVTYEELVNDTQKWFDTVGSFTGEVNVFLFPLGSPVFAGDSKSDHLRGQGFNIHCGIGPRPYFYTEESFIFMDRISLNGYTMRTMDLSDYFNVKEVYSDKRTVSLKR